MHIEIKILIKYLVQGNFVTHLFYALAKLNLTCEGWDEIFFLRLSKRKRICRKKTKALLELLFEYD
jgi:hypothetical protein